jgi:hypothetical protein
MGEGALGAVAVVLAACVDVSGISPVIAKVVEISPRRSLLPPWHRSPAKAMTQMARKTLVH